MRFDEIRISNYRQYREAHFVFSKSKKSDVHIMVANNGVGKTNLLNAINWCLYGDEPHLSGGKDSSSSNEDKLPLCNSDEAKSLKAKNFTHCKVQVEIIASQGNMTYAIKRVADIHIDTGISRPFPSFSIEKHEGTRFIPYTIEESNDFIRQYFPQTIRQYFFFDGEQLRDYFTNKHISLGIKDSVFELAQVNVLNDVKKHLGKFLNACDQEITNNSPDLGTKLAALTEQKEAIKELKENIDETSKEIAEGEKYIDTLNDIINGNDDVVSKNKRFQANEKKITEKLQKRSETLKRFAKLIRKYATNLLLYQYNKQTNLYIEEHLTRDAAAIQTSAEAIEKSLKNSRCVICGSSLGEEGLRHLQELLSRLKSTPFSLCLSRIKSDVDQALNVIEYDREKEEFFDELNNIDKDRNDLQEENNTLNEKIRVISNLSSIEEAVDNRTTTTDLISKNREKLGSYRQQLETLEKDLGNLQDKYDEAVQKSKVSEGIKAKKHLLTEAKAYVENARDRIVADVKTRLQDETIRQYNELLWKKEAYDRVELDDRFSLKLFERGSGKSCLSTTSAAENELLALAFTFALHDVSGYDNLLFIDTPVGRVDKDNRANIANVLTKVGEKRQIILAFTPTEYSEEISNVLNAETISSVRELKMTNGVVEVKEI